MTARIDHYAEAEALLDQAGASNADQAWDRVELSEPPSPLIYAAIAHGLLAIAQSMPVQP